MFGAVGLHIVCSADVTGLGVDGTSVVAGAPVVAGEPPEAVEEVARKAILLVEFAVTAVGGVVGTLDEVEGVLVVCMFNVPTPRVDAAGVVAGTPFVAGEPPETVEGIA